jgi:transglutaminase-like putative cysteine protease
LPPEVLTFLLASRYCEVDRMMNIAWQLFGTTPLGWARVQAVCNWVHNNVTFGYQYARPTKTAWDVYQERNGVCRDFMHLAITFLRALNVPCRYVTGYLGDIGVPSVPCPMDFSAWFEVYLGGRWWTMDARHNVPRVGRILMGHGRDAVDVALTTSFGAANLSKFTVWTDELK